MRSAFMSALLAALLFGCGGDGGSTNGSGTEEHVQSLTVGLVRADEPTTTSLPILKPFYSEAIVELAEPPTGAFAPTAGTLPMIVPGGESPSLWITFTPPPAPADADQQGTIRLLFRRSDNGDVVPLTLNLHAEMETASARLLQTQFQLGNAAVGESVPFGVYFENTSAATPIMLNDVTINGGEFSVDPDGYPLPCPVGPNSRFFVKLLYKPQAVGNASSVVSFHHSASAQPLEAAVAGNGIEPRITYDGFVPLDPDTFESEWLAFDVGPEAVGIYLEIRGDPLSVIDLIGFEGPAGEIYEDYGMNGPLGWLHSYPAGVGGHLNVALPDSNLPEVQLSESSGLYWFRVRDSARISTDLWVRATVSQRRGGEVERGTLDLRVFLADALPIANRADPMSDAKLSAVIATLDAALGANGIRLGAVSFTFMLPEFDVVADDVTMAKLFIVNTAGLPEGPLNLFLVANMQNGVGGIVGAAPGPVDNGTPYSGVVIDFNQAQGITVGATAAHQVDHYLGHADGGVPSTLPEPDGVYPMLRHPLMNPGLPTDIISPPESTNYPLIDMMVGLMPPMAKWCATCSRTPLR